MKYSFVIPVYLSRPSKQKWQEGDAVYDHPTPIDEKGTLIRTLESLESIKHEEFNVILLISATTPQIENRINGWVQTILNQSKYIPKNIYVFSHDDLRQIQSKLNKEDLNNYDQLLSLKGYSQVRNIGFLAGILSGSDAIIELDDDELVKDRDFIKKINQGLNKKINGEKIRLITGACPEGETGSYVRVREKKPWMVFWDKIKYQNEAFDKIIGSSPRWKVSPFAHGGLSIIHKDVFTKIPYDPYVQRGEDMDLNMNARMFGYSFYMDNELEIRHCPPPRIHPQWKRVREDMIRYLWQRNKILFQKKTKGLVKIVAKDFDPYPGPFLKEGLDEMIYRSQTLLAMEYLADGKLEDAKETLNNVILASSAPILKLNAFDEYLNTQKKWLGLVRKVAKMGLSLQKVSKKK